MYFKNQQRVPINNEQVDCRSRDLFTEGCTPCLRPELVVSRENNKKTKAIRDKILLLRNYGPLMSNKRALI